MKFPTRQRRPLDCFTPTFSTEFAAQPTGCKDAQISS
jgi:hypothetical protein